VQQAAPSAARADQAGPEAGCTTAPERKSVRDGQEGGRAPEAGSKTRLHFGSIKRLHFGSKTRLHDAGDGARRAAAVAVTDGRLDGSTERSTELTPMARRSLGHVGADLLRGV
jgi:hypothetical protein